MIRKSGISNIHQILDFQLAYSSEHLNSLIDIPSATHHVIEEYLTGLFKPLWYLLAFKICEIFLGLNRSDISMGKVCTNGATPSSQKVNYNEKILHTGETES